MIFRQEECEGVNFLTFQNSKSMTICLCEVGASLYDLTIEGRHMVMTPYDKKEFIADKGHYYGQTVGPLPMRYKKGKYTVVDKTYRFPPNDRGNALHSSICNYGFLPFAASVELGNEKTVVLFKAKSELKPPRGEMVDIMVAYTIYEHENRFHLDYLLTPHADYCLNPTNHIYWTMGVENIEELILTLPSTYHLRYDKDLVPMKKREGLTPVYDFNDGKRIGQDIFDPKIQAHTTHGYDHYFFLDDDTITLKGRGLRLKLVTSAEGVQVYTTNYVSPNNRLLDEKERYETPHAAVTLETLDDPRAGIMPVTMAGQTYTQHNEYTFEKCTY